MISEKMMELGKKEHGIGWKEFNMAISKIMQNYCDDIKRRGEYASCSSLL